VAETVNFPISGVYPNASRKGAKVVVELKTLEKTAPEHHKALFSCGSPTATGINGGHEMKLVNGREDEMKLA
jgi:hypothetical protein